MMCELIEIFLKNNCFMKNVFTQLENPCSVNIYEKLRFKRQFLKNRTLATG